MCSLHTCAFDFSGMHPLSSHNRNAFSCSLAQGAPRMQGVRTPQIGGGDVSVPTSEVLLYYRIAVPFDSGGGVGGGTTTRVVYRGPSVDPEDV